MLTDSKIKAAIKSFALSKQKSLDLVADGRRGSGRLVLVLRQYNAKAKGDDVSKKFALEWYARFHTLGGKRKVVKIGNYPEMSLAQAVQVYSEDYAPKIARGEAVPKGIKELRREAKARPTVKKLFDAYVAHLEAREAAAAGNARCALDIALKTIDEDRPANEVTVDDIKAVLRSIFKRGVRAQASTVRSYISAAFSFGMKSAKSYTSDDDEIDFVITVNPVTAIPRDTEASKPG